MPNINLETGIPYGVVSLNGLEDWVFDEFLANGRNLSEEAALEDWRAENPDADEEDEQEFWDYLCIEEPEFELSVPEEGLKLGLSYLGGAPLVWVFESPYTSGCRPCSPCCPGAGDLDSKDEDGMVAYDLPPEWYYKPE